MTKNSPLASMSGFVDAAVRVECILGRGKHGVENGLLNVGAMAIDGFQGGVSVDGDAVGAETVDGSVLLVAAVEFEVAVAGPGVVDGVPVCETCKEGTGVFGERVESEAVDC